MNIEKADFIIKNIHILTMDGEKRQYKNGVIAITGDTISYIGDNMPHMDAKNIIDGKGKIALPGLINTHTHSAMIIFRGYGNDLPLWDWLSKKMWPLEDQLTAQDAYWLSLLAMAEMIQSGTTTFSDMYMFMDKTAEATSSSGMRAVLARGLQGPDDKSNLRMEETKSLYKDWHNGANGRIRVRVAPHAIYTCSTEYLKECIKLAISLDTGMHTHVSETHKEVEDCLKANGKTPVKYLYDLGFFDLPSIAAHCVHLNDEDIDLLKEKNVQIAHCPASNLKLASGIAPIPKLVKNGINVALGTDGASSNNNLSMMKEMNLTSIIHKGITGDPTIIPAPYALEMATINGARALNWQDEIGSLEKGKKADVILVDTSAPHWQPINDIPSNMVYSSQSSDIDTVIVNGKILMEDGILKTIDLDRVYYEVNRIRDNLMFQS